jgi:enoyl-CoA hydratase/carnithine racemase
VLLGNEYVFTAGSDIEVLHSGQIATDDAPVSCFTRELADFPKPLLAGVCGAAAGIGSTLLLHCDLVIAGENARLIMPFVDLGICPEAASSLLLPNLLGHQRAARCLLLGESLDASAACSLGLVTEVLPPFEVANAVRGKAAQLARKPLTALMETKRLMKLQSSDLVKARMKLEGDTIARMQLEPAAKEAFRAFLEKRPPDFSAL